MKFCSGCERCYDDGAATCADGCADALSNGRTGGTEQIAGYKLEQLIGSGVRGETYTATRLDCGRTCVVRIVHANDATAEKFLHEAATAQAIFHHGIADIYEAGRLSDGEIFIVSENAQTRSLRDLLDEGPPDLLTAMRIARQTAEAVHALHTSGIAHRAVNPANISLTTDHKGELLVRLANIDLGGAVEHVIVSNKFLIDTALDSLRYFSPEQCRGDASTAKSDIYALGVVLYEMLAGEPPFDAANASGLIEQHLSMHAPEIKINNFDLRALISHSLMEALQKQPSLRQASADLFARQMRHVEQLATHAATPPPVVAVREQPKPAPPPAAAMVVPPVDLDLPSLADVEAAGASFAKVAEPMPVAALQSNSEERNVIAIGDAYSETLGPRAAQDEREFEIFKTPSTETGLFARAASFASGLLNGASRDEPAFPKTIDFSAVRRRIPALLAKAEKLKSAPRPEPKLIKWDQALDDVPPAGALGTGIESSFEIPNFARAASTASPVIAKPIKSATDPVPPPASIERAKAAAAAVSIVPNKGSAERNFVPAFLAAPQPAEPAGAELFAAFEGLSAIRFPRARRAAAAGAVCGALALAFVLRGDIAEALTPYDLASEYPVVPVRTASGQLPVSAAAPSVTVSAVPDLAVDQTKPEVELPQRANAPIVEPDNIRPIAIASAPPRAPKKEAEADEPVPVRPQKTIAPVKTEAIVPSTRVITYSKNNAADRDPFTAPKPATGLTRPRIVKNPNP